MERVIVDQPRAIIEVGSGLSTLLSARALEEVGADGHVFTLEHEMHWLEVTNAGLHEHGLEHRATVLHAPLTEVKIDSEIWKWYDLEAINLPTGVGLLLVDGPPQSTGSLARYPALPALLPYLADDAVIFLDDGIREDETEVAERWAAEIPGLSVVRHQGQEGNHRNPSESRMTSERARSKALDRIRGIEESLARRPRAAQCPRTAQASERTEASTHSRSSATTDCSSSVVACRLDT